MKEEQDLTTGSVPKKLILFALPILFANLLQSVYSIADMVVVGNIVGETGLAAISNASMVSFIINSVCIGITMGGTVLTAQYKGANDEQGQIETAGTLFGISLIASFIITVIGLFVYAPLFQVLNVPAASMQDACEYMKIVCCGTVFVFGYNAVCSVMKGLGDSKSPLYFVATAAVFNFELNRFVIRRDTLRAILKVGLPAAVQMAVVNVSYLLITGMLNNFGVSVAAASGVGLKVNTFAGMPCWAVGQAVTAMAGQNMGADDMERVRKTTKTGLYLNVCITLMAVIFVQLSAEQIIMLFEPESSEVIKDGVLYLRICCGINSLIYAVMYTFDSFAIGIGSAGTAMINALLDAAVVRLPVCWLLAFAADIGFSGIYIGQAVSPILPAAVGLLYFKSNVWAKKKLIRQCS